MNREITVKSYCPDDLHYVKKILSDYPSPTGRVWSEDAVEELMSDALKEQRDGVFVAEITLSIFAVVGIGGIFLSHL